MTDLDPLWNLAKRWYDVAANEMIGDNTRHTHRECANQLEDVLAELTAAVAIDND